MEQVNRREVMRRLGGLLPFGILAASEAVPASATPGIQKAATIDPVEQRAHDAIASVKPAVALLEIETEHSVQWGTCFFISSDGTALTNRHVVRGAQKATCILGNKERKVAKILKIDEQYDLALVKVDLTGVPTVLLGDSDVLPEGLLLGVTGYPEVNTMVQLGMAVDCSTSRGSLNALRYGGDANTFLGDRVLQIDAPVSHGNSGGPVFRLDTGEVVGVLFAGLNNSGNLTFAVPINPAKTLIAGLGVRAISNYVKPDSKAAIVEPGELKTLNTISTNKELPPFFGDSYPFMQGGYDLEQTRGTIQDWLHATGEYPARVTAAVLNKNELFFGGADGALYRVDTTNLIQEASVLLNASDKKQIFVFPPLATDQNVIAVSAAVDISNELRSRADTVGMISGLFGGGGKKNYTIVRGTGTIVGINRRNGNIDWTEETNFASTLQLYKGRLYYGGIGERGVLDALQGTRVALDPKRKNRAPNEGDHLDYLQKDGDKPYWNHLGYAGALGAFTVVVPMQSKEDATLRGRDQAYMRCHDVETGKPLWKTDIGEVKDQPEPMSTAMFVDEAKGIVYALALQIIVALDAKTGKVKWKLDQGKIEGRKKRDYKQRFSPGMVIVDDVIYIGSSDKKLHAVSGTTGEEIWSYPTRGAVGQPTYHEGQIIFGSQDKYLHVLDARSGELRWRVRLSSPVKTRVIVNNGMIYAPTEIGSIYTLRLPVA